MTDNPIQNFGLRFSEFEALTTALKRGDESLFERIFVKHFEDCRHYLIRECNAPTDDAYDMTLETIITFRKKLIEGALGYGNLRFYFTKMAKDSYLKLIEKRKRTPVSELVVNEADREEESETGFDEEQLQSLEAAWSKLNDDCRNLLRKHIYEGMQLKQIATQTGENETNMRKRKERCMDKLKSAFFDIYQF